MKGFVIKIFSLLVLSFSRITPSTGYGSGAPTVACDNLTPQHGVPPQSSPSPYNVLLERNTLQLNTPLNITLTSKNGRDEFKGFLVQVRKVSQDKAGAGRDNTALFTGGSFEDDAKHKDARVLACGGKPNLAMTHKSSGEKKTVTVRWTPNTPGQYRVHTTFVKDGSTFWANQVDDQVIEVYPQGHHDKDQNQQSSSSSSSSSRPPPGDMDMSTMCSTMKLNPSLEPEPLSDNPYLLSVGPKERSSSNDHNIYQKELMWINVTSEYGSPILKMFMQIRSQRPSAKGVPLAVGKFISVLTQSEDEQKGLDVKLVDCFGGKANAILFTNLKHEDRSISDVSILWEAPQDQVGDYQVVATALSQEESFWDTIGNDPESGKIKVLKRSGKGEREKETSVSVASSSASSTQIFGVDITITKSNGINGTASILASFIFGVVKVFLLLAVTTAL